MKAPRIAAFAAALALAAGAAGAVGGEATPWTDLDKGLAAARKSGKPLLIVTIWKPGGV